MVSNIIPTLQWLAVHFTLKSAMVLYLKVSRLDLKP